MRKPSELKEDEVIYLSREGVNIVVSVQREYGEIDFTFGDPTVKVEEDKDWKRLLYIRAETDEMADYLFKELTRSECLQMVAAGDSRL